MSGMFEPQTLEQKFESYIEALRKAGLCVYGLVLQDREGHCLRRMFRSDDRVNLYSATKTITSIAASFALEEELIDFERSVAEDFVRAAEPGSLNLAEGGEALRLRHLLTMSTGKRSFWFGAGDAHMDERDWAELFWEQRQHEAPGSRFYYSNAASYILARWIAIRTGMSLRDYLLPRLFKPLGIVNPLWATCPKGYNNGATGLYLKLDEFARIGALLLEGGVYKGRRVFAQAYFDEMSRPQIETNGLPVRNLNAREQLSLRSGYGYGCWIGAKPGAFRADGKYGQFLAVYPESDCVLTVTAHEEEKPYRILSLFEEHVLEA